jgi:pimeloyl-ACP methyl ester carboxylesterase
VEVTGEGRDVVLLHGGGGGAADLAALRDLLQPGRRIIAPDQRGHGRSPDLGELTYAAMAHDTAQLLDELGVRAADLVGWSDGGIIAAFVARDRPDLVRRVVAISANVSSAPPAPAAFPDEARAWVAAATADQFAMPPGRETLAGAAEGWPSIVARLKALWLGDPGITLDDLERIDRPILYLAGDGDVVRAEHTIAMFRATPGAQLAILPNASHELPRTHPRLVAAIVERFLAEPDPA